jgi:hypothetical protein
MKNTLSLRFKVKYTIMLKDREATPYLSLDKYIQCVIMMV